MSQQPLTLDVNMDEMIWFTNQLENLPRSAFPRVVRGTLNSAAFDVKQNTMPREVKQEFVNRDPNFFKANSRVEMARGNDVQGMRSIVGFDAGGRLKNKQAVEDLEDQDQGGIIGGRAFVPTDAARTGKSKNRMVARRNRIKNLRNVIRVADAPGKTDGEKFIKSAIFVGAKGFLLTRNSLLQIDKMERKGGKWRIKTTQLYSYKEGRSVKVKATNFMKRAVEISGDKLPEFYAKEAKREYDKHFRR